MEANFLLKISKTSNRYKLKHYYNLHFSPSKFDCSELMVINTLCYDIHLRSEEDYTNEDRIAGHALKEALEIHLSINRGQSRGKLSSLTDSSHNSMTIKQTIHKNKF